jgi:hypothetical protein
MNKYAQDRHKRLENLQKKRIVHRGVKPDGDLMSSVRLGDLRGIRERELEKQAQTRQIQQNKITARLLRGQLKDKREMWRTENPQIPKVG